MPTAAAACQQALPLPRPRRAKAMTAAAAVFIACDLHCNTEIQALTALQAPEQAGQVGSSAGLARLSCLTFDGVEPIDDERSSQIKGFERKGPHGGAD